MYNGTSALENSLAVAQKIEIELSYDPAILLLGVYPRLKTCPHRNLYTNVHSSVFIIAKKWKQPKCPSANEWLNKMWYIHTMQYYSAIKRNEVLINATTWVKHAKL